MRGPGRAGFSQHSRKIILCTVLAAGLHAETLRTPDAGAPRELRLTVGRSLIVDSPVNIQRASAANGNPGKLCTTKSRQRQNAELPVVVTPELVRPVPADQPPNRLHFAKPVKMNGTAEGIPQTTRLYVTGPLPVTPEQETVPSGQPPNPGLNGAPAASRK